MKRQGGARIPFGIARNNIIHMQVDAIINSANPKPVVGLGTDSGIHEKAGPELLKARRGIAPIPVGRAAITPACDPYRSSVLDGGSYGEEALLHVCYDRSLELALELDVAETNDLIVRYFIGQGNYNPVEINLVLYEFDQSLPGE